MHACGGVDCRDTIAQHGHCNIWSGLRKRQSARTDRIEPVRDALVMTARKSMNCTLHGQTTCVHSLQCVTETADGMWACAVALDCAKSTVPITLHRQVSIEAIHVCEFSSARTISSTCDVLTQMSFHFMRHLWRAAHQSCMLQVITSTEKLEQSQFL